jgi:hypothetical protein
MVDGESIETMPHPEFIFIVDCEQKLRVQVHSYSFSFCCMHLACVKHSLTQQSFNSD